MDWRIEPSALGVQCPDGCFETGDAVFQGAARTAEVEPHVPWNEEFLRYRFQVYRESNHSLAPLAQKELDDFLKHKQDSFFDNPRNM